MTKERERLLEDIPVREQVLNTLNYCLETFQESCQYGECDPCTQGQEDIQWAIRIVEKPDVTSLRRAKHALAWLGEQ